MFDKVCEWKCKTGTQSLGRDRWGRNYWQFNSIPGLFVETDSKDIINTPCDLDSSVHSEKVRSYILTFSSQEWEQLDY